MSTSKWRLAAYSAAFLLGTSSVAACGASDADSGSADKSLTIGIASGWAEDVAVTYLWKHVLEEEGYEITLKELDIAPMFVGVAKGDLDLYFDTWLPITHEDYWKEYEDQVEDLGSWYDQATLNVAVPEYMDVETFADLEKVAADVENTVTGIESGAGLTRVADEALKHYGLDMTQKTSSTPAMLAALQQAIDDEKPIVVTLWHPHWAYSAFPIKDLEDPDGVMGSAEDIHTIGSKDFVKDHPELTEAIKKFRMDDATLADLEKVVLQDYEDDTEAGVEAWVAENQEYVDSLMG